MLTKMRQAKYPKKALLIISDGGDNRSRCTEGDVRSTVKEANVLLYAIGIYDCYFPTEEERLGPTLLSDITELTGGQAFTIDNPNDLADAKNWYRVAQPICAGLPSQESGARWQVAKIKVKLIPPRGLPPLRVYAKTGYYAPTE